MTPLTQTQIDAAQEFYAAVVDGLRTPQGVHAVTAIAAMARLAGTFLLRSFGLPIDQMQPGTPVLSDMANEQGPRLINILGSVLANMEIVIDPDRIDFSIPPADKPQLSLLETQAKLEPALAHSMQQHLLSYAEAADAAAAATALVIAECADIVDPHAAFNVAAYGFVEGTKTVPNAASSEHSQPLDSDSPPDLAAMLAQVTEQNLHAEVDTGPSVGRETE